MTRWFLARFFALLLLGAPTLAEGQYNVAPPANCPENLFTWSGSVWACANWTLPVISITGNYEAATGDRMILANGTLSVFLPNAAGNRGIHLGVKNIGTGIVTIIAKPGETIDGAATIVNNSQYRTSWVISDGTQWWIRQEMIPRGVPNGVATLDAAGKVPLAQLPALGVDSGVIVFIDSGVCPVGYSEVATINGRMIRGTLAANLDVGTTGGSDSVTPTFTGQAATLTHSGTAVADHASHTHTFTSSSNAATPDLLTSNTASSGVAASGTTAGPSATLTHNVTQPSNHSYTPAGTISAVDTRAAFIRLIACKKV